MSGIEAEKYLEQLTKEAKESGYKINPDKELTLRLAEGLQKNKDRYGDIYCPCRLIIGKKENYRDIICPCNYRDDDIEEYGACFCALYVGEKFSEAKQIPDRRTAAKKEAKKNMFQSTLSYPVWRCSVCGYLCARNAPPEKCPICKVSKDRFEKFI